MGIPTLGIQAIFSHNFSERFLSIRIILIFIHVLIFRRVYMHDYYFSRFLIVTRSLVISIILLVNSSSLITLLLGWDGLGVSSFFLVIWYQRWSSLDGGIVTFISNRLGDFFLIWGLCIFLIRGVILNNYIFYILFVSIFMVACITKSAQIPFSAWLPLAIRAPTPISSLVHSRTLVTGGVFLALKFGIITREFLWVGTFTIIIAGVIRVFEIDAKKIVALRTLSQLGFIISGIGFGIFTISFFHIVSHAFIKRSLLIIVGVIIVASSGSQDKRLFHISFNNICFISMLICCISLCGLAFTSGIVSKESLLLSNMEISFKSFVRIIYIVRVRLTFIYSFRLIIVRKGWKRTCQRWNQSSRKIVINSLFLIVLSIFLSWFLRERFFFYIPRINSVENIMPFLLVSTSIIIYIGIGIVKQELKIRHFHKNFSKRYFNRSKIDRFWVDRLNNIIFIIIRIFISRFNIFSKKWSYIFLYLLIIIVLIR